MRSSAFTAEPLNARFDVEFVPETAVEHGQLAAFLGKIPTVAFTAKNNMNVLTGSFLLAPSENTAT